jgi:hypothetical protein
VVDEELAVVLREREREDHPLSASCAISPVRELLFRH